MEFFADAAASKKGLPKRGDKRLVYVVTAIQESPISSVLLFKMVCVVSFSIPARTNNKISSFSSGVVSVSQSCFFVGPAALLDDKASFTAQESQFGSR